ncbi:dihydroxyacetone kinase family protein [Actinoplanes bogorensis]|uniref:Dihydroxyacetone kinase family protein n=1 Tax=Paractinoplanes bogorensis TaxID=1610840 RepID=A0ABS5YSB9_9ACTN|nr:dihydroxyacetone kinase family protein [Actinoplanes bogorensis]MBU2666344.1 dihydroxyacetone kinase family protein [Actinoplanes bogorensis]
MSYLRIDASTFRDDMIGGFVAAHGDVVRPVTGGVTRVAGTPAGQVAVVIGGGSGHYPAFAGLVGPGLAHGAAMGEVFASPSAQQVYAVARAVAAGSGVLLAYGNYAGDVLNFDQAEQRLRSDGIPCRTVVVTDDIASATPDQAHLRRGIAGDFVVFRAAGWAAEQGRDLDDVWELADRANRRTRSLGVAFSGCTLPGADGPLFTVPAGRMAVGIGIHGEPGIDETALPSVDELAELLTRRVLAEAPAGERVAVILNGLGSVKAEELFVIYQRVATLLNDAGRTVVQPEVGELATSFEMAGVSLTVTVLDEELEQAWTSPAHSAAYRRGTVIADGSALMSESILPPTKINRGSDDSRAAAAVVVHALHQITATIDTHIDELGRLDALAGDGDHGLGMHRGATAATAAADEACQAGGGARATLDAAAQAWADKAGGTSGALWGLALAAVAAEFSDDHAPATGDVVAGVRAAAAAITRAGKAELGDKTMVDALLPFADRLAELVSSGADLGAAWPVAAETATSAARATADLQPRLGRARAHTTRSIGSPDPGAVSMALALTAVSPLLFARKAV